MITRIKIFTITLTSGAILLFTLCLGSQNMKDRHAINLGAAKTVSLPSGFIVGLSLSAGVIMGGIFTALLLPEKGNKAEY